LRYYIDSDKYTEFFTDEMCVCVLERKCREKNRQRAQRNDILTAFEKCSVCVCVCVCVCECVCVCVGVCKWTQGNTHFVKFGFVKLMKESYLWWTKSDPG
jgi:hypothetical protein